MQLIFQMINLWNGHVKNLDFACKGGSEIETASLYVHVLQNKASFCPTHFEEVHHCGERTAQTGTHLHRFEKLRIQVSLNT